MKKNKIEPKEYPYGDDDIPEIDLPPATDDIPVIPSDLPLHNDPDIPPPKTATTNI